MYHDKQKRKHKKKSVIILLILFGLVIYFLNVDRAPNTPPEPVKVVTKQPKAPEIEKVLEPIPQPPQPMVSPKPEPKPKYKTKWENKSAEGEYYSELFTHTSEDMTGLEAKLASGIYKLSHKKGSIYQVSFRQAGESCKLKADGSDFRNIEIIEAGHAFKWGSKWEGKPCDETYEAFYEIPVKMCVSNCK